MDLIVIVFYQLKPPSLSHVEIFRSEDIVETLIVYENLRSDPLDVLSQNLQGQDHDCYFQVMCWIVSLMILKLPWGIGYYFFILQQNYIKSHLWGVAKNDQCFTTCWKYKYWYGCQSTFQLAKTLFTLLSPFILLSFSSEGGKRGCYLWKSFDESSIVAC